MTVEELIAKASAEESGARILPELKKLDDRMGRIEQMILEMADTIMTTEQVAELLLCDPQTVLRYMKEEGLEGVKRGRGYFFRRSHVLEFMTSKNGAKLAGKLRSMAASRETVRA